MKNPFGIQTRNQLSDSYTISICDILFILLSIFYFVFAFHLYQSTKGFPGFTLTNVDEIYFTYLASFNYHYFGPLNSLFLPDYASGIDPAAHPYVYTHNIAFPNFVGYIMMLFGLQKLEHFSFVSIFLSYIGYSVGYLFFRKYVGRLVAIILFFLIITNYQDVLTHSLGFFRAFQWILFFIVPYAFLEWSSNPKSYPKTILFYCSLLLAVSYEYTFALKLYVFIFFLHLFNVYNCRDSLSLRKLFSIMMTTFLILKSLQFIMVWGMFGFKTAIYDNLATLSNRMLPVKDTHQLVNYYSERGILFWVYGDKPGLVEGVMSVWRNIIASYGIIPVIGALGVAYFYIINFSFKPFTYRITKLYSKALISHIAMAMISLSFAYQSYSWWMRYGVGMPIYPDFISVIKVTFPSSILLFISIYLVITLWKNKKIIYLSFMQYSILLVSQSVLINILFYNSISHFRIIQNIFIINLALILLLVNIFGNDYSIMQSISNKLQEIIDIIRYKSYKVKKKYSISKDSTGLISCMILSFIIYSILFYTHVQQVNLASAAPLIEMYTISVTSFFIYLVYQLILKNIGNIYLCILFFIAIFFMQYNHFVSAYDRNPPLPMAASDVLPKYKGKTFVTSYHSVYPTIFTKQWSISNWNATYTQGNITKGDSEGYIWLKDKRSPGKQGIYSNPDYYLHINRMSVPSIDVRMKDTLKIVEKGDNYEIYRLR